MLTTHTLINLAVSCIGVLVWLDDKTTPPIHPPPTAPTHNTSPLGPTQPPPRTHRDTNQPFWPMRFQLFPNQATLAHGVHDLNNDGRPDILTADFSSYTVSLNRGSLHFENIRTPSRDIVPTETIFFADLNNDTYPDAILCSKQGLNILLNTQDGHLKPSETFRHRVRQKYDDNLQSYSWVNLAHSITSCATLRIQDTNKDQHPDITFTGHKRRGISSIFHWTLTNQGNGTFNAHVSIGYDFLKNRDIYQSDLDQNHIQDRIELRDSHLRITLHHPYPKEDTYQSIPISYDPYTQKPQLRFLHTNQDTHTDLLIFDAYSNAARIQEHFKITIHTGRGDGTFQAESQTLFKPCNKVILDIAAADLDLDGFQDLIVLDPHEIHIWYGTHSGHFQEKPDVIHPHPQPLTNARISTADFDGDGDMDLFIARSTTNRRPVQDGFLYSACSAPVGYSYHDHTPNRLRDTLYINPALSPTTPPHIPPNIALPSQPEPLSAHGDFDGDGTQDLYTYDALSDQPHRMHLGSLHKASRPKMRHFKPEHSIQTVLGINLNHDRYDDLLLIDKKELHICYGGPKPFSCKPLSQTHRSEDSAPVLPTSDLLPPIKADLDKDGLDDIILVTPNRGYTVFLQRPNSPIPHEHPQHVDRYYGHNHTLHTHKSRTHKNRTPRQGSIHTITAAKVADLNHDTHLDLILTSDHQDAVYLGQPNGLFSSTPLLFGHTHTQDLIVHDFNNDTHPDILTVHNANFGHFLWLGNGDGTFHTTHHIKHIGFQRKFSFGRESEGRSPSARQPPTPKSLKKIHTNPQLNEP